MQRRQAMVLFDVDGTLLVTGGASSRCIRRACQRVFGERFQWGPVSVGTLDHQIFLELASRCGIADAERQLDAYKELYLSELEGEMLRSQGDVKVMPGVREVLRELSVNDGVIVGLLTGNYRRAVELKLDAAGLDRTLFRLGAFAEDGSERFELVPAALRQWEQLTRRRVEPRSVILVGDTPRDIECARLAGCSVLAVATGHYSLQELRAANPDRAVANLANVEPLRELIVECLE